MGANHGYFSRKYPIRIFPSFRHSDGHHCPIFGDAGRFLRRLCIIWKSGRSWIPTSWLPASDHAHAVPWRPGESGGPGESSGSPVKLWMGWWKMKITEEEPNHSGVFYWNWLQSSSTGIAAHYLWWPSTMFVCFRKEGLFGRYGNGPETNSTTTHSTIITRGVTTTLQLGTKCNCYHPVAKHVPVFGHRICKTLQTFKWGPSFRHPQAMALDRFIQDSWFPIFTHYSLTVYTPLLLGISPWSAWIILWIKDDQSRHDTWHYKDISQAVPLC